jgi:ubiquinone/menaquinone biosynthesis C-methylase UbiE
VLDIGAGTGFHLPRFLPEARHVIALESHGPSRRLSGERFARLRLRDVSLLGGSAEVLPLRDYTVDLVHARFTYFFAPHCDPGVRELERVIRPGGIAFIIENDLRSGTFASWLRQSPWVEHDPDVIETFWQDRGFSIMRIPSHWSFGAEADLEAVVRIEFSADLAEKIISEHEGTEVEYHYLLIHKGM